MNSKQSQNFLKKILYLSIFLFASFYSIGCQTLNDNLEKLRDKYSKNRVEAIYWLYQNYPQTPATLKLLTRSLQYDKSEVVRSLAARLIALQKKKKFIPLLIECLKDKSPLVRMEVIQSLGSLHAYSAIPVLISLLQKEPDLWVRLKILKTFNYMKAKESIPGLIHALEDQEPAVRFQALTLLKRFTGKNIGMNKESWQKWYEQNQKEQV